MVDNTKETKLTRIVLGGLQQLSNFSGDFSKYESIGDATFKAVDNGHYILAKGKCMNEILRGYNDIHVKEKYLSGITDSFLRQLNEVLERQGLYLINCQVKQSFVGNLRASGRMFKDKNKH